ncbi:MAG: sigma 54-interacting transcriptional regulator, partial [Leptospira sp.]|nr:sigma 54-interacting transcriptional regulator [Leptospira sp.]
EKIGAIERANFGTLFLDEVCDLPLSCQLKLQRTIQEGKLERIGSEESIILDVRILSATNLNIDDVLADGKFRRELFYLLNVVPISLPPLRERAEDIPALTNHYLERFSQENETKPKIIEPDAMDVLTNHFWPGNIRELKNILERLSILVPGETITAKDVKEALLGFKKANEMVARGDLKHAKEEFERQYIIKTMQVCEGNVTRASKVLGIERTHLYRKLKSLNINVDQMGEASA